MGMFNIEAEVVGRQMTLTFPPCLAPGALEDLCEFVGVRKPEVCPTVKDGKLVLILKREPRDELDYALLTRGVQGMVECWLRCYSQKLWQSWRSRAHLRMVAADGD